MLHDILKSLIIISIFIAIIFLSDNYKNTENKTKGIDISHHNGSINWKELSEIDFVIIKATGGNTFQDPMFENNWQGASSTNLKKGAYHFYYADDDPITQANNFLQTVKTLNEFDLPAILDIESLNNTNENTLLDGIVKWLENIETKTNKTPIIYSGLTFYKKYLLVDQTKKYPIWLADYDKTDLKDLEELLPNRDIIMWQYTSKAQSKGINGFVDMSFFYGELDTFIKSSNNK